MIREFIRDNRNGIKIGLGVVLMIAGLVVMILSHFLLGLLIFFLGIMCFSSALGSILSPSDYAGDGTINGFKGMGRQQSSINKNPSSTVASETTSDIWNQMTGGSSDR